jgi:hypothetical protein
MKTRKNRFCAWKGILIACAIIVLAAIATGCKSLFAPMPPPLTLEQIVEMSQGGTATQDIIQRICASGAIYHLKASQFADLKARGVPDEVLNYMQQSYEDAVRINFARHAWMRGPYCWNGGYPYGFPYVYPYGYGWPPPEVIVIQQQQPPPPKASNTPPPHK